MSKGSTRRPTAVPSDEWAANYARTFAKTPRCFLSLGPDGLAIEWEDATETSAGTGKTPACGRSQTPGEANSRESLLAISAPSGEMLP